MQLTITHIPGDDTEARYRGEHDLFAVYVPGDPGEDHHFETLAEALDFVDEQFCTGIAVR